MDFRDEAEFNFFDKTEEKVIIPFIMIMFMYYDSFINFRNNQQQQKNTQKRC